MSISTEPASKGSEMVCTVYDEVLGLSIGRLGDGLRPPWLVNVGMGEGGLVSGTRVRTPRCGAKATGPSEASGLGWTAAGRGPRTAEHNGLEDWRGGREAAGRSPGQAGFTHRAAAPRQA